jgi:ABC-type multidrug transport system permease subunit
MLRIAMVMPDYPESNILIGVLVVSVVWNAVNILLLFSAHKNSRPSLMLPWLICKAVLILLCIGLGLFVSIHLMQDNQLVAYGIGILFFFAFGSGTHVKSLKLARNKLHNLFFFSSL